MILDTFSKRNTPTDGDPIYTWIPAKLKNQIYHIWTDFLGQSPIAEKYQGEYWDLSYKDVRRELGFGRHIYSEKLIRSPKGQLEKFYEESTELLHLLDTIEILISNIELVESVHRQQERIELSYSYTDVCRDLNTRFKENNFGFRYHHGKIIRIDSDATFQTVVVPAFALLSTKLFQNANREFLEAHKYFRNGGYEACINESEKAFESVMKVICHEKKWDYQQTLTAKPLTKILIKNHLIPEYMATYLLIVAEIRNQLTAHGKGVHHLEVPEHLASFVMDQTASIIKYLIGQFNKSNLNKP